MSDPRLSKHWDRALEGGLPDCRRRYGERPQIMHGRTPMEAVYCANCGVIQGHATVHTPYVFFICDACFYKAGGKSPEGTLEIRG